jgi:osmotically-inducible protein OsmY
MRQMNRRRALAAPWAVALGAAILLTSQGCSVMPPEQQAAASAASVDDSSLSAQIKTELARDPELAALDIKVDSFKGVVHLSGFAPSRSLKAAAIRIATDAEGVLRVQDGIVVKS